MNKIVGVALVGRGYWGSILRKYLENNEKFDLRYVCGKDFDIRHIVDNDIEAVAIVTPNETHYELAKSVLLAGKHVLVEKPLSLLPEQCEELKKISRDKNLVLLTEYTYTFSRGIEFIKKYLLKNEILGVDMSVRHLGRFGRDNVYWLLGSHMLSVLDMLVDLNDLEFVRDDIVEIDGNVETGEILFGNGKIRGKISLSLNYPWKETNITIYCKDRTIKYDSNIDKSVEYVEYERLPWTVSSNLPKRSNVFTIDERNNLRFAVEYFYKCIIGLEKDNVDRAIKITKILNRLNNVR